ncbi:MAG: (deoxy)nucleoside triphosphate pyrophosphohydrolase [Candidatus Zhuqueibacterota bacterium]
MKTMHNDVQTVPHYDVAAGLIVRDSRILIAQRMKHDAFGGKWEFPGGKKKLNETLEQCLVREILEELNFHIQVDRFLFSLTHTYNHLHITLHLFLCSIESGQPQPKQVQNFRWIAFEELDRYHFTLADQVAIAQLSDLLKTGQVVL